MNIAMEQTEEYVNGQLKNKYGDAFIRGNNGIFHHDLFFHSLLYEKYVAEFLSDDILFLFLQFCISAPRRELL